MKKFNTAGLCIPELHYMVDISNNIKETAKMVAEGEYFCINRGRQYGKTTTLYSLCNYLKKDYIVFSISFEGLSDKSFENEDIFYRTFLKRVRTIARRRGNNIASEIIEIIEKSVQESNLDADSVQQFIYDICCTAEKPIVLIIDEVDQAGNHEMFIRFLGMLRAMYLQRHEESTFHSVILAGVYDVKNLKLKMRPETEHQYNSPWNIAVPYEVDMSLSAEGIAGMLTEYAKDNDVEMDAHTMAELLREYTKGYPFLVSRLCQLIVVKKLTWNQEGLQQAVKELIDEKNTLFDDMAKKLHDFKGLKNMLQNILFNGAEYPYNVYDMEMDLATMFGYIKRENRKVAISNRIFEIWLYDLFTTQMLTQEPIYTEGSIDKNGFIKNGVLDMRHVLERFAVHYNEIYSDKDAKFLENTGRKLFLLYLRPIINGVGHYYIEAQTRNETRTDVIVDYLGKRYIIEMKIWRGSAYNEAGKQQLAEYLDLMGEDEGYLLSFCFNKTKNVGITDGMFAGKNIVEVLV